MRKKAFSLLELLIAITLSGIILTTLIAGFSKIIYVKIKIDRAKEKVIGNYLLKTKLKKIFKKPTQIELKNEKLSFEYNNEIDPDPDFCKKIRITLFLDENNNFKAVTLPLNKKIKKSREELLAPNITYFKVLFFKETGWEEKLNKKEKSPKAIHLTISPKNSENLNFYFIR